MAEVCAEPKKNLGKTKCIKVPQLFAAMIETPNGFFITEANLATAALLKAALQTAIKSAIDVRIYKWPKFSHYLFRRRAEYNSPHPGTLQ